MKQNTLTISVKKPIKEVFAFTITPPNSTLWIPSIINEETNEWPIQIGTRYTLTDNTGSRFIVIVSDLKPNKIVQWSSEDGIYHCRYTYYKVDDSITELQYHEWVDSGHITDPFSEDALVKLKRVLESDS